MGKGPEVTKKRCVPALIKNADEDGAHKRRGRGGGGRDQPGLQAARRTVDLIPRALGNQGWVLSRGRTDLNWVCHILTDS